MADISKIKLPNGNEYDLKVHTDHIAPMMTKTFTGVIGTANTEANARFFYGKIQPTDFYAEWSIKFRLEAVAAGRNDSKIISDALICGTQTAVSSYHIFNRIASTSYRPVYYHSLYRATSAGITNEYGHALGIRLYSSWNAYTAANARTITISIIECVNCKFTFFDSMLKYAAIPGTGTTNYTGLSEYDAATNGLQETGDANDVNYQNRVYYSGAAAMKSYAAGGRYTLTFTMKDPQYVLPITSTDNKYSGEAKTYTTEAFDPFGEIYYRNSSSAIAANANVGNATLYRQVLVDARYSFTGVLNGSTSLLAAGKPVYIVCSPQSDGSVKLHSTPLGFALPTTDDGLLYILLGFGYNTYQFELLMHHPVYQFKDGAVRDLRGMAQYALALSGTLDVAHGGTGATTAREAAQNLGVFSASTGGTLIPNNSDINDYNTPGTYYVDSGTNAATMSNGPTTSSGFKLFVDNNYTSKYVMQFAITATWKNLFYRGKTSSGTWGTWARVYSTESKPELTDLNGLPFGTVGTTIASGTDLNTIKTLGAYCMYDGTTLATCTNCPDTEAGFKMYVSKMHRNSRYCQLAIDNTGRVFIRIMKNDTNYSAWNEIHTTGTIGATYDSETETISITL